MLLEKRIAIVTGSGQGLGRGIASAMAAHGATVVVLDLDADKVNSTCRDIVATGAEAIPVVADVTDREQVDAGIATVVEKFHSIDILVNNAIATNSGQIPFEKYTPQQLAVSYEVGQMGTVNLMQACFPYMKERGGSIINFGSAAGVEGHVGMLGYAAAKEGIRGITRVAAHEWGQFNIRVNSVLPFGMSEGARAYAEAQPEVFAEQLQKVPLRRAGDPQQDVGNAVVALASDLMAWTTGATIPIDGGMCIMS